MEILLPWNTSLGFNCYNYPSAGGEGIDFPAAPAAKPAGTKRKDKLRTHGGFWNKQKFSSREKIIEKE